MNTCWSNIKISSNFSFWKLNYFSDMAFLKTIVDIRKILDDKLFMFFFQNPVNHIEFSSVVFKSNMDSGCISLKINPLPITEIQTRAFPVWIVYVIDKVWVLKSLQSWGFRLNHGNIAPTKTTDTTKILWVVLSWICNMYMPWPHYGKRFYTQSWLIKVYLIY